MKRVWLLLVLCSRLGAVDSDRSQPDRVGVAARPAVAEVVVVGMATESDADREATAKLDASRKAIEQVAGRQVKNLAIASRQQLVANYTVAQAGGFVEAAEPVGPAEIASGVYLRRYRIRVRAGEINKDLVTRGLDVDFLYEAVARPRIALALRDETKSAAGDPQWHSDGRETSAQTVVRLFKERHPGFVFKDLDLLRDSGAQAADYVREAHRGRFDVLVVGHTRAVPRGTKAPGQANPWLVNPADRASGAARHEFDAELEWRVVNVATAETLMTISGRQATPPDAPGEAIASPESGLLWVKERLLAAKAPELFRELMAHWNRQIFSQEFEIVVQAAGAVAPEELARLLREKAGLAEDGLRLVAAGGGEVVFTARAAGGGPDIAGRIGAALAPLFIVHEVRPGRVTLVLANAVSGGLRVELSGVGFTAAAEIERGLAQLPRVLGVKRIEYAGGRVIWQIAGAVAPDEVAGALERLGPVGLRVGTVARDRVEAAVKGPMQ